MEAKTGTTAQREGVQAHRHSLHQVISIVGREPVFSVFMSCLVHIYIYPIQFLLFSPRSSPLWNGCNVFWQRPSLSTLCGNHVVKNRLRRDKQNALLGAVLVEDETNVGR